MARSSLRERKCRFCSASFDSNDALRGHLNEYRVRAAELEKCQAHANANVNEESEGGTGSEVEERGKSIRRNTSCPYSGCDRTVPFQKGQQLRVHFRRHVACEEVCVCCFKVFRRTSEFIRHMREHSIMSETKKKYVKQMCAELRAVADKELEAHLTDIAKTASKKRTWEEADLDPEIDFEPAELTTTVASYSSHPFNVPPMTEPAAFTMLDEGAAGSVNTSILAGGLGETFPPAQAPSVDDYVFDPPLFSRLNFPLFPTSVDSTTWLTRTTDNVPEL